MYECLYINGQRRTETKDLDGGEVFWFCSGADTRTIT